MTAEERRTLPLDTPHEPGAAPHPETPPHDPYAQPQYAQYGQDPYARPQPQDLDAVAAATPPQPQHYGEQAYAPQAAQQQYEPAQYAPEPQQPAETYTAPYHEQPAEPQHAQYVPQEQTVDLSYPPPPPMLTEDDLREPAANEPPVAVNENRRAEEAAREPRAGVGAATWIITAIAVLSLGVMTYQTYVFQRGIAAMENNAARGQFVVACRDSIGSYYDARQKISVLMPAADRGNVAGASRVTEYNRLEAQASIAKLSSIVSYLASFQDPGTRVRYTELTRSLNGVMDVARTTPLTDIDRVFSPADKLFAGMNEDCARLSQSARF